MENLKILLDNYYDERNQNDEISEDKPDPLLVVKENLNSPNLAEIAIISALLSYGNAKQIVKTLHKLDFSLLERDFGAIEKADFPLYRFQTSEDIRAIFMAMREILECGGMEAIFIENYGRDSSVISGINAMISILRDECSKNTELTNGLDFLIGRISLNPKSSSPLKRWNMLLRWLVRKDNIDLGLWGESVDKADLILPLDTHTFRLSQKFGLLKRKSYDLQSAIEVSENLARFCPSDPIKYDFAIYRLGQEKIY